MSGCIKSRKNALRRQELRRLREDEVKFRMIEEIVRLKHKCTSLNDALGDTFGLLNQARTERNHARNEISQILLRLEALTNERKATMDMRYEKA